MVKAAFGVSGLWLKYGSQIIVDHVSFDLFPGRITALIGPNGAGKSSIMRIMAGLVKPQGGQVLMNRQVLTSFPEVHRHAGFFIEGPEFYKYLTAQQNLEQLIRIRKAGDSAAELLDRVGLEDAAGKKVGKFSRGMKQRLGIAQALIGDPEILVLDEPFNGLDPEVKQFLMELIKSLAVEKEKAILVSSHILADLEILADDFVLLSKGRIHLQGHLAELRKERQKVSIWFHNAPSESILALMQHGELVNEDPWCWEAYMSIPETVAAVANWVNNGCIPYEIQRADLLHSKYMEIIE